MSQVLLNIPDGTSLAIKVKPDEVGQELLIAAAIKLFEVGRLSIGAAADLAGIPKPLMLQKLSEYGVHAIQHTAEELKQDVANA